MARPVDTPESKAQTWVYASLAVVDGPRKLELAQVSFDRLIFTTPPRLTSNRIELILTNGDAEHRQMADVLPHDANATLIPIQLIAK